MSPAQCLQVLKDRSVALPSPSHQGVQVNERDMSAGCGEYSDYTAFFDTEPTSPSDTL